MDLFDIINQLSHPRYLGVEGGERSSSNEVVPTHQIKGLQFLETLDLSNLSGYMGCYVMTLDLVDLPRLSHLSVQDYSDSGLPRGIGEMKQLRTLSGFDLGHSSSGSVIGLGELTALSELSLVCSGLYGRLRKPSRRLRKSIWMAALSTSLEKLDKLKSFDVSSPDEVAQCADTLSSLSPTWGGSLERLDLKNWSFSIVPMWISHLRNLKELYLGAKQIIQEDIGIIWILPSLI
jgi:Leucine-rich repeat (LRR) protein